MQHLENMSQRANAKVETWLAKMMSAGTWGVVLVAELGIVIIGVGLFQFKEAANLGFMNEVDRGQMSRKEVRYRKVPLSA